MREACSLVWSVLVLLLRSRALLEAEILILRHQLNIQRRHLPKRLTFSAIDRLIFVGLYRLVPGTLNALTIVKRETVVRWHRAGFRSINPVLKVLSERFTAPCRRKMAAWLKTMIDDKSAFRNKY
jgi:hypothetical protein